MSHNKRVSKRKQNIRVKIPMDNGYGYGLGHGQVHDSERTLSCVI